MEKDTLSPGVMGSMTNRPNDRTLKKDDPRHTRLRTPQSKYITIPLHVSILPPHPKKTPRSRGERPQLQTSLRPFSRRLFDAEAERAALPSAGEQAQEREGEGQGARLVDVPRGFG